MENEINETTKLCSLDIVNMYTNIPTDEVRNIIKDLMNRNYNRKNEEEKNEILNLLDIVLEQNYVHTCIRDRHYIQNEGLAMGAPTSAILSEVFLQNLEHMLITDILKKHHIIDYYRYVDDILIVYNTQKTNIIDTLNEFNTIHHKIKFKMEQQSQNKLNYLDLTIMTNNNELKFAIYRKPTSTDLIIHNTSCHPYEHKKAAINYLRNRINTYKLTNEGKIKEEGIINRILVNNEYPPHVCDHNKKQHNNNIPRKDKWTTFTYFGPNIRSISKLFRNINIKIAFKTNNTIKKILKTKEETTDKYSLCGVYQMKCKDCDL